jgi:hypothetical protein
MTEGEAFVSVDISDAEDFGVKLTGFYFWGDLYLWDMEVLPKEGKE